MNERKPYQLHSLKSMIIIAVVIALVLVAVIMIVLWTSALEAKNEALLEQKILRRVLEEEGHEGLLKKAGVAVHDIFYGEQGLSVFLGNLDDFTYSADEMRNIAIYEGANRSVVNITTVTVSLNSFLEVPPYTGNRKRNHHKPQRIYPDELSCGQWCGSDYHHPLRRIQL